jgi:hypothetical protein
MYPVPHFPLLRCPLLFLISSLGLASGVLGQPATPQAPTIEQLKADAEKGDAKAQAELARRYSRGEGVKVDAKEAFRLCQLSAAQGNAEGQLVLGYFLESGRAGARDDKAAAEWYAKAAAQGHLKAPVALAALYTTGRGLDKDLATRKVQIAALLELGPFVAGAERMPLDH